MGRFYDVSGHMERVGAVARPHQQQGGGGEYPRVVGGAALFVFFAAVAGAGGVGGNFHTVIVQNAIFFAS
jgi:hypothetical protein